MSAKLVWTICFIYADSFFWSLLTSPFSSCSSDTAEWYFPLFVLCSSNSAASSFFLVLVILLCMLCGIFRAFFDYLFPMVRLKYSIKIIQFCLRFLPRVAEHLLTQKILVQKIKQICKKSDKNISNKKYKKWRNYSSQGSSI